MEIIVAKGRRIIVDAAVDAAALARVVESSIVDDPGPVGCPGVARALSVQFASYPAAAK
jgi:hypothetical protein